MSAVITAIGTTITGTSIHIVMIIITPDIIETILKNKAIRALDLAPYRLPCLLARRAYIYIYIYI